MQDKEDSRQILNDTYLKVWNSIPTERPNIFKLFLAKITRNLSIHKYKKNNAKKRNQYMEVVLEECLPSQNTIEYERENMNDTEYTKLWQYELSYGVINSNYERNSENIGIIFTKEEQILQCMLPDKKTFPISTINGNEVYLSKRKNNSGIQAFFKYNWYKFFVESSRVSESEFITLINSIIK